jgi:hypothetical protein
MEKAALNKQTNKQTNKHTSKQSNNATTPKTHVQTNRPQHALDGTCSAKGG